MGFKIKDSYWLKTEADRVEGIILMEENWGKVWEATTLQAYLKEKGITYTVDQVTAIGVELISRGVVEAV